MRRRRRKSRLAAATLRQKMLGERRRMERRGEAGCGGRAMAVKMRQDWRPWSSCSEPSTPPVILPPVPLMSAHCCPIQATRYSRPITACHPSVHLRTNAAQSQPPSHRGPLTPHRTTASATGSHRHWCGVALSIQRPSGQLTCRTSEQISRNPTTAYQT